MVVSSRPVYIVFGVVHVHANVPLSLLPCHSLSILALRITAISALSMCKWARVAVASARCFGTHAMTLAFSGDHLFLSVGVCVLR